MSKDTPFFKFDAKSWLAGSIQYCTLEQKGLFIDLCAHYWDKQKPIQIDNKFRVRYREGEGSLELAMQSLSDLDLILISEAGIRIPFLDCMFKERAEWIEQCRINGRKAHSKEGRPGNKNEERRKKKEECRKKNVDVVKEKGLHPPFTPFSTLLNLPDNYINDFFGHCQQAFLTYKFNEKEQQEFMEYWLACDKDGYPLYVQNQGFNPSKAVANQRRYINDNKTVVEKALEELQEDRDNGRA